MVVTFRPTASETGTEHDRTDVPSKWTVQEPHWPTPHPNFVPVSRNRSRMTHRSGVSGATSTE